MASREQKQAADSAPRSETVSSRPTKDSLFILKILMYIIIGSLWVRLVNPADTTQVPIPVGVVIGFIFASHEHFQIDRKLEYSILLFAMFIGFLLQTGVFITY